ncbi:hypothetical protein AYK25_01510 [Thermoplasmatales archaeon SM1-50]|nr:MAG: hypothetical protein AYK25_01510 [Thermoplasmatales archaeon SM1-50]
MKLAKKIIVGCLILLLTTTPLIVSAGLRENVKILSMNRNNVNSLGTVTLTHQPLLYKYSEYQGMKVNYTPPPDNPHFIYNFTELENGSILLNFTLFFIHYLNQPGAPYYASYLFPNKFRYTWVNRFWIVKPGEPDIFSVVKEVFCTSNYPEPFNITVGGRYLETNGNDTILRFACTGEPGITPVQLLSQIIIPLIFPGIFEDFLSPFNEPYGYIEITVHPVIET